MPYMSRYFNHKCGVAENCHVATWPDLDWLFDEPKPLSRGIRPMDIDMFIESGGAFLFVELKPEGWSSAPGDKNWAQWQALKRLSRVPEIMVLVMRGPKDGPWECNVLDGGKGSAWILKSKEEIRRWFAIWQMTHGEQVMR